MNMNIKLHQPFSISETQTGIRLSENIYPDPQTVSSQNSLFISCDGSTVKTLKAGEIVCEAIESYFHSFLEKRKDVTASFIEKAIRFSEVKLDEYIKDYPEYKGMDTSLSMLFFAPDKAYLCQIGRSHIYQIRGNKIIYKSIDSSLDRRVRGYKHSVQVNIVKLKDIQPEDMFFIYTGSLFNFQDEETICRILSQPLSADEKLSEIKRMYLSKSDECFSGHLIPIRQIEDSSYSFRKRMNSIIASFI